MYRILGQSTIVLVHISMPPPPPPSVALAEHLQFIASLPAEYITEFGKAALALLQQQAQGKMFANVLCGLHTWHGSAHALTCAPRLP